MSKPFTRIAVESNWSSRRASGTRDETEALHPHSSHTTQPSFVETETLTAKPFEMGGADSFVLDRVDNADQEDKGCGSPHLLKMILLDRLLNNPASTTNSSTVYSSGVLEHHIDPFVCAPAIYPLIDNEPGHPETTPTVKLVRFVVSVLLTAKSAPIL